MFLTKVIKSESLIFLFIVTLLVLISACNSAGLSGTFDESSPTSASSSQGTAEINLNIELPEGDPETGLNRAVKFRCFACHIQDETGLPLESYGELPSIGERGEIRLSDPAYQGRASTNEEYLLESILYADVYIVPGDWDLEMPTYLADVMTEQDIADVLAWMGTLE